MGNLVNIRSLTRMPIYYLASDNGWNSYSTVPVSSRTHGYYHDFKEFMDSMTLRPSPDVVSGPAPQVRVMYVPYNDGYIPESHVSAIDSALYVSGGIPGGYGPHAAYEYIENSGEYHAIELPPQHFMTIDMVELRREVQRNCVGDVIYDNGHGPHRMLVEFPEDATYLKMRGLI